MAFVTGEPLSAYFDGKGNQALAKELYGDVNAHNSLFKVLRRSVEAVDALHKKGWLHNDLHPGNVMITKEGHVSLIDFGRATRLITQADATTLCAKETAKFASKLRFYVRGFSYNLRIGLEMNLGRVPSRQDFKNFDQNFEAFDNFVDSLN